MTDQLEALRSSVVAAVQQELTRFSGQVSAEVQRLHDELAKERAARAATEEQLRSLAPALESKLSEFAATSKRRHEELEVRIGRVADEANVGIAAAVEAAARPVLRTLEVRQDAIERNVTALDGTVRKFDDQAAKIVAHLNAVSQATDTRLDEITAQVGVEIDGRVAALATRLDEVSAQSARQQSEVSNIIGKHVDQAEARLNDRLHTTEARITEDVGQRVADIDAYVGRVSLGLDESVTMLNDRIAASDSRFDDVAAALDTMNQKLADVDVDAIDELKDRVVGVAGEAELLRIETERFEQSMSETIDKVVTRIVDVETQIQEQYMDVETAVQLERLEEVERAIIALDPSQFVRRDEASPAPPAPLASPASPLSAPQPFQPTVDAEL